VRRGKVQCLTPLNQTLGVESGVDDGINHDAPHSRMDGLYG
jgi:hypothetical protein